MLKTHFKVVKRVVFVDTLNFTTFNDLLSQFLPQQGVVEIYIN